MYQLINTEQKSRNFKQNPLAQTKIYTKVLKSCKNLRKTNQIKLLKSYF